MTTNILRLLISSIFLAMSLGLLFIVRGKVLRNNLLANKIRSWGDAVENDHEVVKTSKYQKIIIITIVIAVLTLVFSLNEFSEQYMSWWTVNYYLEEQHITLDIRSTLMLLLRLFQSIRTLLMLITVILSLVLLLNTKFRKTPTHYDRKGASKLLLLLIMSYFVLSLLIAILYTVHLLSHTIKYDLSVFDVTYNVDKYHVFVLTLTSIYFLFLIPFITTKVKTSITKEFMIGICIVVVNILISYFIFRYLYVNLNDIYKGFLMKNRDEMIMIIAALSTVGMFYINKSETAEKSVIEETE